MAEPRRYSTQRVVAETVLHDGPMVGQLRHRLITELHQAMRDDGYRACDAALWTVTSADAHTAPPTRSRWQRLLDSTVRRRPAADPTPLTLIRVEQPALPDPTAACPTCHFRGLHADWCSAGLNAAEPVPTAVRGRYAQCPRCRRVVPVGWRPTTTVPGAGWTCTLCGTRGLRLLPSHPRCACGRHQLEHHALRDDRGQLHGPKLCGL